jgi:glutamate dehydrogenase (NAD(P)+)
MPVGGAAAFIKTPPRVTPAQARQLLAGFGQAAGPLLASGSFGPTAELGIDDDDVRWLLSTLGMGVPRRALRDESGVFAGLTVALSAVTALRATGVRPSRATAAIEGFGKVGGSAALELYERGIKVVAVSTNEGALFDADGLDVPALLPLAQRLGVSFVRKYTEADRIAAAEARSLSVDLFCPCALPGGIDLATAARLRCRVLIPGARVPLKPGGEGMLTGRGVLYVPDFVATCGGILGPALTFGGFSAPSASSFIERHYPPLLEWMLGVAERHGGSFSDFAAEYAMSRFERVRTEAEQQGTRPTVADMALGACGRGVLPPALLRESTRRRLVNWMTAGAADATTSS